MKTDTRGGGCSDKMPMYARMLLPLLLAATGVPAGGASGVPEPCTDEWNRFVDGKIATADGQGHGPDLGSDEWKGAVEFKLGVRGQPGVPARDTGDWCEYIDRLVRVR